MYTHAHVHIHTHAHTDIPFVVGFLRYMLYDERLLFQPHHKKVMGNKIAHDRGAQSQVPGVSVECKNNVKVTRVYGQHTAKVTDRQTN